MQRWINLILLHIKLDKLDLLVYTIDYTTAVTNPSDLLVLGWFAQSMTETAGFHTFLTAAVLFAYVSF